MQHNGHTRSIPARSRIRAWRAIETVAQAGTETYERTRHLPRLIPVDREEMIDESRAGRLRIVLRLARALRLQRAHARSGHWTYDLNRHMGLMQAYQAEARELRPAARHREQDRPRPG